MDFDITVYLFVSLTATLSRKRKAVVTANDNSMSL